MKKLAYSVLTTSALTVILATPGEAEAASDHYAVQAGDSLWKIASNHQISVTQLKSLNALTTELIYPGQKLRVSLPATGGKASGTPAVQVSAVTAPSAAYTVKSGDTLSKIASIHKITVSRLKSLNGLTGDLIRVGQTLKVPESDSVAANPKVSQASPKPVQKSTPAGTYNVRSGDTLSAIAIRHSITVDQLMKWNGLTSYLIRTGQTLKVSAGSGSGQTIVQAAAPVAQGDSYSVVSGDSLSSISRKFGAAVSDLMAWNNLSNTAIYAGQKLKIKGSAGASAPGKPQPSVQNHSSVIQAAMAVLGTPYVWGGTSTSGFDCSGFIWYAFKSAGKDIARTNTDGYFNRSYYVDSPQPGDLVFFNNTYKKGISHMGIYLGGGKFVHASSSQGVVVSHVNDAYWKDKFDSFKRFY